MTDAAELANALVQRGLMRKADVPARAGDDPRPWFIAVVLGGAGWLAGLFAMLFVGMLFTPSTPAGFGLAGLVMLAAALGLYFADRDNAFLEQLALALWIAGQLGITWWAGETTHSTASTAAIVAVLQIALLWLTPNRLARGLASFFACVAWALAVRLAWWNRDLFDSAYEQVALGPALIGWLVIWVPLAAIAEALIRTEPSWMAGAARNVARPALGGLIAALAIGTWASEPFAGVPFLDRSGNVTSWLALWPLLGTGAAALAAGCAFRLRDRALLGLAIAGALLHVSQFYYALGTTLVVKSAIMLGTGVACLAVAWLLRGRALANDGSDAA